MQNETNKEYAAPDCTGNACNSVSIREIFSGGYLTSVLLHNSGASSIRVTLVWTSVVLAQVQTTTTIFPGETLPLDNPQNPYGRYVGITKALKTNKTIEDDREEEVDATFYRAYCETEGKWLGNWEADQQIAV